MNQWIIPGLIGFIRYDLFVMNKKKKVSKKKCIIWIMQSGYHCNPFIDQLFDQLNNSELIVKIKMTYGFIQYQYFLVAVPVAWQSSPIVVRLPTGQYKTSSSDGLYLPFQ